MSIRRRACTRILSALACTLGTWAMIPTASAQTTPQESFPARPVSMIIPWPPGGPTDIVGRLVAQRLSVLWKQAVVVENKPGAAGTIGTYLIAKAAPDGYTIGLHTGVSPAFELLNPKAMRYNTLKDLASIGFIGTTPSVMVVRADFPASTLREFIDYARAHPTKVSYAYAGAGSPPHFAAEFLKKAAGIQMLGVNFPGTAPAMQSVMSSTVDMYIGGVASVGPAVQSGKAKTLGVVSSARVPAYPELPTLEEQGVRGVRGEAWYGLIAPAGVPVALLDRFNADLRSVLDGEEMRQQLQKIGFVRRLGSRADFDDFVREDIATTRALIDEAKISVD